MTDRVQEQLIPLPSTGQEIGAVVQGPPRGDGSVSGVRKRKRDGTEQGDMGGEEKAGRSYEVLVAINRRAKSIFEAFDKLIRKAENFQSLRTTERKDRFNNHVDGGQLDDAPADLDSQIDAAKQNLVELLKRRSRRDKNEILNDKPSLESFIYVPGGDILHYEGIQWRVNAQDTLIQEIFLAKHGYDLDDLSSKPEIKRRWKTFERNTSEEQPAQGQDMNQVPIGHDPERVNHTGLAEGL